jgi:hypothetical protein
MSLAFDSYRDAPAASKPHFEAVAVEAGRACAANGGCGWLSDGAIRGGAQAVDLSKNPRLSVASLPREEQSLRERWRRVSRGLGRMQRAVLVALEANERVEGTAKGLTVREIAEHVYGRPPIQIFSLLNRAQLVSVRRTLAGLERHKQVMRLGQQWGDGCRWYRTLTVRRPT